jgi:hypothetical protein
VPELFPYTREERRVFLEAELSVPVRLRYGRSGTQPVLARAPTPTELKREPRLSGGRVILLHRRFADADLQVWQDLASWLRSGRRARRACQRLDTWLDQLRSDGTEPAPPPGHPGEHHHLPQLTQEVIATHLRDAFEERPIPTTTWATRKRSTARRGLRLGSYDSSRDLIRIHPVLDQPAVPGWIVAFVLYHELLHALIPSHRSGRRLIHHGPTFRAKEHSHPDHQRATNWEQRHLSRLIRSARSGKPIRRSTLP